MIERRNACEDLSPARGSVIYPGRDPFPLGGGVEVTPFAVIGKALLDLARTQ